MHPQEEIKVLEKSIEEITTIAKKFNLDFYNMYFEICPADIIYSFGSYGMPTRFSHWTFGKAYHKMKTQYDYNLSRIYEMVINTDPCYAFLLEGNSLVQNKMVIAHVLAHCDFFKNNYYFSRTSRKMVESMSVAADRIRSYEFKYGRDKVESFLDAVISLQQNVDPERHINPGGGKHSGRRTSEQSCQGHSCTGGKCCQDGCRQDGRGQNDSGRTTPYDDLWDLDKRECKGKYEETGEEAIKIPEHPEKDLLFFMMNYGRDLQEWQRDIISIVREEMLYFWPQMQTKIMNEGWATYWHMRIMREMDLNEDEALEFAKTHAGVIQPSKYHINPYFLGLKIFEDIEKRWDNPTAEEKERYDRPGGEGKQKIFEVRETENDISFIRNYLTRDIVEEYDLYLYKKVGYDWKVTDKEWESVRDGLVANLYNCGFPYIVVEDGDFGKRGEIYLKHVHEGTDLDIYYLERTLPHVYKVWGRAVHLETVVDGKRVVFTYNGEKTSKKFI
ncbi:SpoVR family protein [Desulfallas thermosapovorans]|uniref:Stage V sporulation protein R n=1 Tax=Desulfallas thermosapovorans DSM 6562 TaxID=1121431 RepID=A0A5S4ZXV7_9FIRM|nr:SpoVR family protein [Desulfallas thermosapovorans]TYO97921.1 stage V sporulation protein R [Desulfallas thermosapovorans DSM 6562]